MAERASGRGRPRGMTLVELLLVITIVGILIALLLPGLNAALVLANISQARHDMVQIEMALNQYMAMQETRLTTNKDAFMETPPPTRQYTTSGKYDLDYCLPPELFPPEFTKALQSGIWKNGDGKGYLDGPPADPFGVLRGGSLTGEELELAEGYRYKALGQVSVNGAAVGAPPANPMSFSVPKDFPKSTGTKTTYSAADWYTAPVRIVIWSAGPEGPPVQNSYSADSPTVDAENPANWYPEKPGGIICRYYTGKDWRFSY